MTCTFHCKWCGEIIEDDEAEFCNDECLDAYLDQPLNPRRNP